MSSEAIGPGDLVVIVGGCRVSAPIGYIEKVSRLEGRLMSPCRYCKKDHSGLYAFFEIIRKTPDGNKLECNPVAWLKKIPPLAELQEEGKKEELPA